MKNKMEFRAEEQQKALALLNQKQWLAGHENISQSFKLATETAATTLDIKRVSVWLYENNKKNITCVDLFLQESANHESGSVLNKTDYPKYFDALSKERIIAADDAHTNEYTAEFSEKYLKPLNITSMLDAPIKLGGKGVGVLCCEHIGEQRSWKIDEKIFAASVADFCSIALELSEHKKTSDELRKHQNRLETMIAERTIDLEIKNKELEAFSYTISHDLRSPLRHVNGYLEIIEEDCREKLSEIEKDYISRTRKSVVKMYDMIDAILHLSRISAQTIKKLPIKLSDLALEISDQLTINNPKVEFDIEETPIAHGDEDLLRIAISNLLENAIKYSSKKSSPLIEFGSNMENDIQVFYIRDNGCGFDMKYSHKLFDVFQRLHNDSEYKGSGIGLSTVYKVIERHRGKIWAKSEIDNGTTFYFTLN